MTKKPLIILTESEGTPLETARCPGIGAGGNGRAVARGGRRRRGGPEGGTGLGAGVGGGRLLPLDIGSGLQMKTIKIR